MPSPERIYRGSIRAFSIAFIGIGIAIVAITLAAGGGPASVGVVMGSLFALVGAGRLWITSRSER